MAFKASFLTFFVLLSTLLTEVSKAYPLNPNEAWYEKQTKQFQDLNLGTIGRIIEKYPDLELKTTAGEKLKLTQIKEKIKTVQYRPSHFMLLKNGPSNVSCTNQLGSQWITKHDSPSGKPVVMTSKNIDLADFGPGDANLAFHETISALGIVDDEYQVSAPLLLLIFSDPMSLEEISPLFNQVQLRQHAPRAPIDESENCYRWLKHGIGKRLNKGDLESGGTITGVGGGGSDLGIAMKIQLLLWAGEWWKQNNSNNYSQEHWNIFYKFLNDLGIEEANTDHIRIVSGGQFELKKSKRTGKNSIFIYSRSSIDQNMAGQILRTILSQAYEEIARDKKPPCYDQIIWGGELALEKKIISEREYDRRANLNHKNKFWGYERFLISKGKIVTCKTAKR